MMVQRVAKSVSVSFLLVICSIVTVTYKATAEETAGAKALAPATAPATPTQGKAPAKAKTQTKAETKAEKETAAAAAAKADSVLSVTGITVNETSQDKVKFEIFQTIKITVKNLEKGLKKHNNDLSKLILYIDGNAVNGLHPTLDITTSTLQFDLKRIPENKDAWTTILSRGPRRWERNVPITVGFEKESPIESTIQADLTVINQFWFKVFVFIFLIAIGVFWAVAKKSDIIRDTGPQPKSLNDKGQPNRKPYSLARTQMALWFFVVIISYVFIWLVMKDSTLNTSVLALIGISASTAIGSAVLDASKRSDQENKQKTLEGKKNSTEVESQSLQSEINTLLSNIAATPAPTNIEELKAELGIKQAKLAANKEVILQTSEQIQKQTESANPLVSKNFISDILSDDEGVSFHRFQIFTWTIVLIVIFSWSVYNLLTMPEFDSTLLGLMGISGGTYIGFKFPNQQG